MGLEEVEALDLARKIVIFNSEVIYNIKNSLMLMTPALDKSMSDESEKYRIIISSRYNHVDSALILATTTNNQNHDLFKLEVDLIKDLFLEAPDEPRD